MGRVEIGECCHHYRHFRNFAELIRAAVTYMVLKANDRRTSPLATMNFVALELTTSDRRHKPQDNNRIQIY
ncbi:hypothetical protein TNCV_1987081 [Trichonephila clavipes]|nr:hypothetical protein TNCV_1987081 [Trichonephila clavipes]